MTRVRKAVIPAAGTGKRFYPLTRAQPKEMLPILDKPVIHYVVEEAVKSGLDEILIIVGHGKDAIIDYFDYHVLDETMDNYGIRNLPDIYFIRQKQPLGLGDALKYAEKFVDDDPFAVLLGDTIYVSKSNKTVTSQLLDVYSKIKAPVIAVEKVKREKIRDYGIISGKKIKNSLWKVDYLIEKPEPENSPSNLGITGIYILQSDIFEYLKKIGPGKNNEYQLTDALNLLAKEKDLYAHIFIGKRYDIGTKELWYKVFMNFLKNNKNYH
ncbi:MAG: UTP--glucose-1-phosphate uridylyltransferase [Thermoplasmata archaeon]|jgi:UTP--glucose-1-phosphate uridylyltransferase